MTTLQQLAIRHIKRLAESMKPPIPCCELAKTWTDDECRRRDKEYTDKWSHATTAQREIVEWATALGDEHDEQG